MIKSDKIKHILKLFVYAGSAESGPPLGTVLGNLGVNTVQFCKQFNEFTQQLPPYLKLKVTIYILDDRSFDFSVSSPSTGQLISLLKKQEINLGNKAVLSFEDFLKLTKFKFPHKSLEESLPIMWGSIKSSKLIVKFN